MECEVGGCQSPECLPCSLKGINVINGGIMALPSTYDSRIDIQPKIRRKTSANRKSWYASNSDYLHNCHLYAPVSLKYSNANVQDVVSALRKDLNEKFTNIEKRLSVVDANAANHSFHSDETVKVLLQDIESQLKNITDKAKILKTYEESDDEWEKTEKRKRPQAGSRRAIETKKVSKRSRILHGDRLASPLEISDEEYEGATNASASKPKKSILKPNERQKSPEKEKDMSLDGEWDTIIDAWGVV